MKRERRQAVGIGAAFAAVLLATALTVSGCGNKDDAGDAQPPTAPAPGGRSAAPAATATGAPAGDARANNQVPNYSGPNSPYANRPGGESYRR